MSENRTYHVVCLSEAISPITHMSGSKGNESIVAREPVVTKDGVVFVPCLSGNAIRHRCVRMPGARWLVEKYGLRGRLSLQQLNYLFHGGNLTEGGGREDTSRISAWQELFPLGRLLGGTLPNQILSGSLLVGRGSLVCEENRTVLQAMLPQDWQLPEQRLRPAEAFVSGYQYTRSEASKTVKDLLPPPQPDDNPDANLMIFSGQAVTRGACFVHTFVLQHVSLLELGALIQSLRLWQYDGGGTVGGQAARGHGKLKMHVHVDGADKESVDAAVLAYREYAESKREAATAFLFDVFEKKKEPPRKSKSKAAETAEA